MFGVYANKRQGAANKYTHIAEADNIKFANALHCTASLYKIHTRIYKESTNTHIIRISNTNIYTKLHIFLSHYYIAVCTKSTLVRFPALSIATAVRPTNMVYFAFESSAPYLATLWMVVVRPQMNSIREYIYLISLHGWIKSHEAARRRPVMVAFVCIYSVFPAHFFFYVTIM